MPGIISQGTREVVEFFQEMFNVMRSIEDKNKNFMEGNSFVMTYSPN